MSNPLGWDPVVELHPAGSAVEDSLKVVVQDDSGDPIALAGTNQVRILNQAGSEIIALTNVTSINSPEPGVAIYSRAWTEDIIQKFKGY